MSTPAVTVRPDDTLAQAARLMAVQHVKRLPVVDDADRLCGVVSHGDEEVRRTVVPTCSPCTLKPSTCPCGTGSSRSAGPSTTLRSSGSPSASSAGWRARWVSSRY